MERLLPGGLALCAIWLLSLGARAEPAINTNGGAHALAGYDVVAYFTDGHPVRGDARHTSTWAGAVWLFASAEHKELFERAPDKYLPAYGGYCAYGLAQGKLVRIAPEAFTLHQGRLFLNYSLNIRARWLEGRDAYIEKANANWRKL
jgi:YHS domain-containing protein